MIELHDGKMKLESEEGKGTRVTIIFPAYRVMVPETAQPAILKAN
jgi:signal transduction histidine kinase